MVIGLFPAAIRQETVGGRIGQPAVGCVTGTGYGGFKIRHRRTVRHELDRCQLSIEIHGHEGNPFQFEHGVPNRSGTLTAAGGRYPDYGLFDSGLICFYTAAH